MHALIDIVLLAGGFVLSVLVTFLALQIALAVGSSAPTSVAGLPRPRVAVLVPAHDESDSMVPTLQCLRAQMRPGDRCVVVADNCSDDTAAVAARAGVEVVERFDAVLRGKGYALDAGIRSLGAAPPEVLVVLDADCVLTPDSLDRIASVAHARRRPVQALYVMAAPPMAAGLARIAEFAGRVKNRARPLGSHRLGLPCPLMGTGMALPWDLLALVDLASGHIVEDAMLSIDFTKAGHPPLFCAEACVVTTLPGNVEGSDSQRTRWEHGNLTMIVGVLPRMLVQGLVRLNARQVGLAIDLLIPPLALFAMIVFAALGACILSAVSGGSNVPAVVMALASTVLCLSMGVAWFRYGRDIVPFGVLALAPLYALRKIPLYLRFVTRRQTEWVRSKRDVG